MLQLAKIFQTGMVLQRGKSIAVWGMAGPHAAVAAEIQGRQAGTRADEKGRWKLNLAPLDASGKETLKVVSGSEEILLEDVAVGEVWIAAGQSNMEFHMRYEKHLAEVKPVCTNPKIRFFDVPEVAYPEQADQFDYTRMGVWRKADPENIEYFSAVGYYFARALEKALDVPVGIVGCNWGGTASASWMNPETVRTAGPEWMAEYDAFAAHIDLEQYFARQSSNLLNDRGRPFEDPFGEFVMPKTRTQAELAAWIAGLGDAAPVMDGSPMVQNLPGALYRNMVQPTAPFGIRGVLWYQGESDDVPGRQKLYAPMLAGLIQDWRALWQEEIPFLIVQLPGFERWLDTENHDYAAIRQAQKQVTDTVPHTWLCSISDMGERYDIHPKDKRPVGERLSLLAQEHLYGIPVCGDAPAAVSAKRSAEGIAIRFDHAEGGLECRGDTVSALRLVSDGEACPYHFRLSGDTLWLMPEKPLGGQVEVHYADGVWYQTNLYNCGGIPAIPFVLRV